MPGVVEYRSPRGTFDNPRPQASSHAYSSADTMSAELSGFHPAHQNIDSAWGPAREKTVSRVNDLVRNDGWASNGLTRYLDSVIGADLRLSAKPDYRALGLDADWAAEFSKAVEAEWRNWANDIDRYSDAERFSTIGGLFALAFRHKLMDGDALALAHWLPNRGGKYATTIQIVDPDRLSNPHGLSNSTSLTDGVERDQMGAAVAYWFRKRHPGDRVLDASDQFEWKKVSRQTRHGRRKVVHYFEKQEAGQARGVSKFAPIVERLKMLTKFDKVYLQSAVLNAVLAAVITSPHDHELIEQAVSGGHELNAYQTERAKFHKASPISFDGAIIPKLFPGESIEHLDSKRPDTAFADFEAQTLRNVAGGIGVSYEQLSNDWSKTNYSSARAALLEVWRSYYKERETFAQGFCSQIYALILEEMIDRGTVQLPENAPDFYSYKTAYCKAKWIGPARGWVDPLKEADAAQRRLEIGVSTLEDEAAEQGKDWEEIADQRKREQDKMAELGLTPPSPIQRPQEVQVAAE